MMVFALTLPFEFNEPVWLWVCLLVPLLLVTSRRSLAGLDPVRRYAALLLRSALVIVLACCLAGLQRVQRNDDLTVMFLMDRSHSVQAMQDEQEHFMREASKDLPADDRVGVIDFARHAFLEQQPLKGGYVIPAGRFPIMQGTDRTDVASAMRLAMAMFPHDTAKRMVLLSDGNDNMGNLLEEARRAAADGIPVDIVPLRYRHKNEVYFERVIAPTHAQKGEQIPVRMVVHTDRATSGTLLLYVNGQLLTLPEESTRLSLHAGDNTFVVTIPVLTTGAQTFEAVFRPDDVEQDTIALNNSASAFTFVSGPSRVLLITSNADSDRVLANALESEGVGVELRDVSDLGQFDLLQMVSYTSIILSNVSASNFTDDQQRDLVTYVKDMGSGLIMLGGDESFGAGGWIGSPVAEIMPVSFEIKHKRVIPRGALVIISHSCEIPRGNFWGKEMAKRSVDTISSQDYVGVLAYTYSPGGENWEVPLDLATNKAAVKAKIDRMQIGDMPDFGATMTMALRELTVGRGKDAAQKHVIILSDGDASAPSNSLVQDFVRNKITVSTIAIGWGGHVMQATLRDIAKKTGGKFYAARNPKQLPQIFSKESKVIKRPLIVDAPFQPAVLDAHSELLAGVDGSSLPALGGMVLTSPKDSPNVIIPLIRPTDDGEDPVLAHWQYELGKTVAFTSGQWEVWGGEWTSWSKYAKFWAQVVRWTMRQDLPANFDTYTRIDGDTARIVIDALDKDASYLNNLQLSTRVINPNGVTLPVKFVQTGPGKYEASVPVDQAGQYLANVQIRHNEKYLGTLRTGVTVPFSPEYRDLVPNEAMLRQVSEITNGRWLNEIPEEAGVFKHDLPPSESKRPAWDWALAWLLLPIFLLDVSVRRLASWLAFSIAVEVVVLIVLLFGMDFRYGGWSYFFGAFVVAELVGWSVRFRHIGPFYNYLTHGVTALATTGQRSEASLGQLKSSRNRGKDDRQGEAVQQAPSFETDEPLQLSDGDAQQKFDAKGGGRGKLKGGSLVDSLGGAKKDQDKDSPRGKKGAEDPDNEDATSRLLRAKRRARRDMDEDNK